ETMPQLLERQREFQSQNILPRYLLLRDLRRPVSPELDQLVRAGSYKVRRSLSVPAQEPTLALKLRSFYWRLVGSPFAHKTGTSSSEPLSIDLELDEISKDRTPSE